MQFKLTLDDGLVKELDDNAKRYGRKTANQVAVEIITLYLPLWKASAEAQFDVIREQGKAIELSKVGFLKDSANVPQSIRKTSSRK